MTRSCLKLALPFLALFVIASGCQLSLPFGLPSLPQSSVPQEPYEPTHEVFLAPQFEGKRPRRIVLIPSNHYRDSYEATQKLIAELAHQMRAAGVFEVVTPNTALRGHEDNIMEGRYNEREIARIARTYNAGGIGLVRVNELRSYVPLRSSVTVAIIDANESYTACGVEGVWDLGDAKTQADFKRFHTRGNLESWDDLSLQSPDLLFRYIASHITTSVGTCGY